MHTYKWPAEGAIVELWLWNIFKPHNVYYILAV